MATSTVPFPILKAENFSTWKYRIRLVLNKEGSIDALDKTDEDIAKLDQVGKLAHKEKDAKAQYTIAQSIPHSMKAY